MKRMQKNHKGSTLVECIAAFAIFSLKIPSLLQFDEKYRKLINS